MTTELEKLSEWIRGESGFEGDFGPDVDLLDEHILDSFSIVQLAMFVQDEFGIELEAEDLVRENLSKMSSIVALIHKRRDGSSD